VKKRSKRCTLATGFHISLAKIADRYDSGAAGNFLRVSQLNGLRLRSGRLMPHCLSVRAYGCYGRCCCSGIFE